MTTIKKIKERVKKEYEKQAPLYDEAFENYLSINSLKKGERVKLPKDWLKAIKNEPKNFMELTNPKNGELALDIACGTGRLTTKLAKKGAISYAIDFSPKMIKVLKQKIKKNKIKNIKQVKLSSMEKLPFKDNFFDIATCMGALEHYPLSFVKKCLKEMKRVIKHNGRIVIDIGNKKGKLSQQFYESGKKHRTAYLYDKKTLKRSFISCGLRIIKTKEDDMEVYFLLKRF